MPMTPEHLLQKPPGSLDVRMRKDAYGASDRADLIREVMGMANLPGDDPRYILVGATHGDSGEIELSGLDEQARAEIAAYPDMVRQCLEPELGIRVNCSRMQGKLVCVVEIDGCDNSPYMVCKDVSQDLKSGACWLREPGGFRPARRDDLDRMFGRETTSPAKKAALPPSVAIGFGDDPTALQMVARLPELNSAPSIMAAKRLQEQISVVKAAGECDVADSSVVRLVHAQQYGSDLPYDERGMGTLIENFNAVGDEYEDADAYYYLESNALKLNFCIRNDSQQALEKVAVVMTLPVVDEFKVVGSLCAAPGLSEHENDLLGYPEVSYREGSAQVRQGIDALLPGRQQPLFESALRIALRPEICGKKIAIRYALHARGLNKPQEGVLKLVIK